MDSGISAPALVGAILTLDHFERLSGMVSGHSFVKVVVDRWTGTIHFIDSAREQFHAYYIAKHILGITVAELDAEIDEYNRSFYVDPDRRFYLGVLCLHRHARHGLLLSLETVEVDLMSTAMLLDLYRFVRRYVDPALSLRLKPATHRQEEQLAAVPEDEVPQIAAHEIFSATPYFALQPGTAAGRLRAFRDVAAYYRADPPLEWYDIVAMERAPDDIPRLSGIVNAGRTTPLSHTNVLAAGWGIPNAVQVGALDLIDAEGLDGAWVWYEVDPAAAGIRLTRIARPPTVDSPLPGTVCRVTVEPPDTAVAPIAALADLRVTDVCRYGTKAAHLGELLHLLTAGSDRLLGWYQATRDPRPHLMGYLRGLLGVDESADVDGAALGLLREVTVMPGVALPFALHREFLESSPELGRSVDGLRAPPAGDSSRLRELALRTPVPEAVRRRILAAIRAHLGAATRFVVRSSSNAEDLAGFPAAGLYTSVTGVTTTDAVIDAVRRVWASLYTPRGVRLRHQAGIAVDDARMGVVVQEQAPATMGGVLVTTNPAVPHDFRNVYLNVSTSSVEHVVNGVGEPIQMLFNTVEGGGRTISLGDAAHDLAEGDRRRLERLALIGRFLQAHFAFDTVNAPVDIEWVATPDRISLVQLRPYAV
ncbi:PEP/pyruvate-binding domain-containing protein [Actinoplanes subglobosus]|uniref:PEP/pyruvate-binding domain-containing protein n=1 Tax=Actinoplanes subglobosus TaxID=1547892 RepID=A0ABV8J1I5_9ACTN